MTALRFAILGLGAGALYAIAAQGIVLVYRGSGVLNFAHGAIAAVAAYLFAELHEEQGLATAPAIVFALLVAAFIGVAIQVAVMRPLRNASPISRLIATLGVLVVLQQLIIEVWGPNTRLVDSILPDGVWRPVADLPLGEDRISILGIGVVVSLLCWAVSRFTLAGWAVTATAENPRTAASLGWSPDLVAMTTWALGAVLAGIAGILLVPITGLQVSTLVLLVLPALAAALVGRFTSFPLTLLGGLLIGVAEALVSRYVKATGWSSAVPFFVVILVLVARGSPLPLRGESTQQLPAVGSGRVQRASIAAVVAASVIFCFAQPPSSWLDTFIVTLTVGTVCLSLVVLTGYAGQLSLAQVALAGIGAFTAGRLVVGGTSFELAFLAGIVVAIIVGLLVGLPSLRVRGVSLAVATLGLGLVVERVVLANPDWNGGFAGTIVGPQHFLGIDIDPVTRPEWYALFVFVVFTLTAVLVVNLRRGDAGRRLLAVRSNERAAAALGVDVMGTKLFAFGLASAIAGVAGILLAFRYHSIPFANFNVFESINVVAYTVIGGIGFVLGPIRGSLLAPGGLGSLLLAENAPDLVQYLLLFSGIMLIVFLVIAPNGIGYAFSRRWEQVRRRIRPPKSMLVALPDVVRERVTPKALEVRGMTVRFGGVVALDGVDLDVAPGEVVGVIGPNGAGKTTLLEGICGFVRPAAGTVQLGGQSLDSCSPMRRARAGIGRSFQQLELFEDLTVLDNLRIACDPQELRTFFADLVRPRQRALSAEAVTAARDLGIETVLARRSTDLDHGTRRLVAIARAVAAAPSVLLLDEPAAGLASRETTELGSLIRTLADDWGIGVVLIEHDVELVMRTCDRILVLDFGRELASGTPDEVREHEGVVAAYLGEPAAIESIEADVTASTP